MLQYTVNEAGTYVDKVLLMRWSGSSSCSLSKHILIHVLSIHVKYTIYLNIPYLDMHILHVPTCR